MQSIIFSGVPGVGKTTMGRQLASQLNVEFMEYSTFMLEALNATDRAKIHGMSFKQRVPIYRSVEAPLRRVFRPCQEGMAVLTTHISIRHDGVLNYLPVEHFEAYNARVLVLIEADPQTIIGRRQNDGSRERSKETEREIDFHQNANREAAYRIAKHLSIKTVRYQSQNRILDMSDVVDACTDPV